MQTIASGHHGLEHGCSGQLLPVEPVNVLDPGGTGRELGLDVHASAIVWCLLDAAGEVLEHGKTPTTADALRKLIGRLQKRDVLQVAQEIGGQSHFVHDVVTAMGVKILSFNAHHLRMIASSRKKTDRRDAYWIAKVLQTGMMPHAVYIPVGPIRQLRSLLSQRDAIKQEWKRWLLRARSYLRSHGYVPPKRAKSVALMISALLAQSDGVDAHLIESLELCHRCEKKLADELKAIEKKLRTVAKSIPDIPRLVSIPGVGFLLAIRIYACVGDVRRFGSARELSSYVGIVPSVSQSGDTLQLGSITRQGSPPLRSALVQGGHAMLFRSSPEKAGGLKTSAQRVLTSRKRRKVAVVAAAHKIIRVAYYVLRDGTNFDPRRLRSTNTEDNVAA